MFMTMTGFFLSKNENVVVYHRKEVNLKHSVSI